MQVFKTFSKIFLVALFLMSLGMPANSISLLSGGGVTQKNLIDNPRGYIEAYKARRVGDLVTVRVVENIQSIKESTVAISNQTDHDADFQMRNASTTTSTLNSDTNDVSNSITAMKFPINYGRDSQKSIEVNNREVFTTLISALVVEVDPESGNMVVEGSRQVLMEGEVKSLFLRGLVNPKDLDANNELPSYKMANAQIQIVGSGSLTKERDGGIIQKIFRKLF